MVPSALSTRTELNCNGQHLNGISYINDQLNKAHLNGHSSHTNSNGVSHTTEHRLLDLICVGFGPASLAVAIALHDLHLLAAQNVLFLEKQPQFAWHAGMQLPGAKMQISFLKDLATPRDPRSKFTFLNYLFENGRLNPFINLGTFLPTRLEYEDYLRWCAGHFERDGKVAYGTEVEGVRVGDKSSDGKVTSWEVSARDSTGEIVIKRARHVVIAIGGQPVIPKNMQGLRNVAHSSQFANTIPKIQAREAGNAPRFAVVGSGQSAAEIFNDLWERFPQSQIRLIIKGASLRPSDDSPFVNEIFEPDRVDEIYNQAESDRAAAIALDRGTNYSVVRLSLLEHLYEQLYLQRLQSSDESTWRCRILNHKAVRSASQSDNSAIKLSLGDSADARKQDGTAEELEVDYVFTATGYIRNAHENMLNEIKTLLPKASDKFEVERNYKVKLDENKVDVGAGVWLQGCNEATHGLSDTLLSILAVRGGELVRSIFGDGPSTSENQDGRSSEN